MNLLIHLAGFWDGMNPFFVVHQTGSLGGMSHDHHLGWYGINCIIVDHLAKSSDEMNPSNVQLTATLNATDLNG